MATGASLRVTRRGGAACLHYPATFRPLHDHVLHRHRPPGAARRPAAGTGHEHPLVVDRGERGALVVDRGDGRAGRLGLRPSAGRAAGRRHPGHQDLPLPRPDPVPQPGRVHVEPDGGPRHGQPRVHRLPAPDGAVLRGLPPARRPGLGGTAPVARVHPLRRRARRPLPVADPRAARPGAGRGRTRLHAVAVLPPVLGAHLGDPAPLGRPARHAGPHHRRPAPGRVAGTRPLRGGRGGRQRHQRQLHHLRRGRSRPVAPLRRGGAAGVDLAPRAGNGAPHRRC